MNSSQSQQRKELPKVCKQFPDEFLFLRQKTAQSTVNSLNKVDFEQFLDCDQVLKSSISTASSSAASNRLSHALPFHKNIQLPQLSKDLLNEMISGESVFSVQNPKGVYLNNIFQQNKQNYVQVDDYLERQQQKQGFINSLNQNGQQKAHKNQEGIFKQFSNSSKSKILDVDQNDQLIPCQRQRVSSNLNGQKIYQQYLSQDEVKEEFQNQEDYLVDFLDKIQMPPELNLLNENLFSQQNQLSVSKQNSNIEKKERNNSNQNLINKSQSSSTSKRLELKSKKNNSVASSSFILAADAQKSKQGDYLLNSIALRKNKETVSQTEQVIESQQTEDEDTIKLNLGKRKQSQLETLEINRIQIEKAMNQNNPPIMKQDTQIRASSSSSSSACFQSCSQSKQGVFKQIPYILAPSSLNQNKQYIIQNQNQNNYQINKQLFQSRNNSIENLSYQVNPITIQQNQNQSEKQLTEGNLQNSNFFRLPRLAINNDQKLISINKSVQYFVNNNQKDQQFEEVATVNDMNLNGICKSHSFSVFNKQGFQNQKLQNQNQNQNQQVFAIEKQQQQIKREVKTPNFNTRQPNLNQNMNKILLEEQKKNIKPSKEKNEVSILNDYSNQAIRILSEPSYLKDSQSNKEINMNSFEMEVKNSYYQRNQSLVNNQEKQDLDASFGNNKDCKILSNQFQKKEEYSPYVLFEPPLIQQNSIQISQRKKNIAQKNFKCNKSLQVSSSKNQNIQIFKDSQYDDSFTQKNENQPLKKSISNCNSQERSVSNAFDLKQREARIPFGQISNSKLSLHSYGFSMKNKDSLHLRSQISFQNKSNSVLNEQKISSFDIDTYYQNLQSNLPESNQLIKKQKQKSSCNLQKGVDNQQNKYDQGNHMMNDNINSKELVDESLFHTFNASSKNNDQVKLIEIIQNQQKNNNHYLDYFEKIELNKANSLENKSILDSQQQRERNQSLCQKIGTQKINSSEQAQKQKIEKDKHYFIQVKNDRYLQKRNLALQKNKNLDLEQIIQQQKIVSSNQIIDEDQSFQIKKEDFKQQESNENNQYLDYAK